MLVWICPCRGFVSATCPNFFLETLSVVSNNTLGWMYTSRADYLFYFFLNDYRDEEYLFHMPSLKEWFHRMLGKYPADAFDQWKKYGRTYDDYGNLKYKTQGLCFPIKAVLKGEGVKRLTWKGVFSQ